jgi:serine/threonine protein kinase
MSPEQTKGDAVGPATDVWSFGATMFQILAGRTLYPQIHEGDTAEVRTRKLQKVISYPVDLSPLEGKAPEYVIAIISKCLRKAPEERYHSAGELRRSLEIAIDHLESAEGGETMVLSLPRAGQTLLLHVECQEACLQGAYREYDIEARVGGGAFGEVYRAKERLSGRIVALKVLKHEWLADKAAVERFRREATLMSRLSHPNVLRVHNFGRYGSTFFMDMDLLDGPTLESVRRERGVLPIAEATAHTAAILRGLAAIHEAGMVHRDLKPANVALTRGQTVIFDFGLAHSADLSRLTTSGQFLGTPHYAAPEQAAGMPATAASDVYAAGVMLYEMLTGKTPHEADSVFGLLRKKATEPPTPITTRGRELPTSIVSFVDHLLAMKPEERPTAADAVRTLAEARI